MKIDGNYLFSFSESWLFIKNLYLAEVRSHVDQYISQPMFRQIEIKDLSYGKIATKATQYSHKNIGLKVAPY